jgi:malonyl-CoA decarboxylase
VARFHLGNGARLERVNWLGNTAPRGMRESFGLMVNYLYDLDPSRPTTRRSSATAPVARSAQVDALLAPPSAGRRG